MNINRYNILSENDDYTINLPIEQKILKNLGINTIPNYDYEKYDILKPVITERKSKEKKMLCISTLKTNDACVYGNKCSYAHSIIDQRIDNKREDYYKIIFDKKNKVKTINKDLAKELHILSDICDECYNDICQGGLNCKKGVCKPYFRICRNDFYGNCINTLTEIDIDRTLVKTILPTIELEDHYLGCINGHHLSERDIKQEIESDDNEKIKLVRIIRTVPYINPNNDDSDESDIDLQDLHQSITNDE
jgi:hypothetical protein